MDLLCFIESYNRARPTGSSRTLRSKTKTPFPVREERAIIICKDYSRVCPDAAFGQVATWPMVLKSYRWLPIGQSGSSLM